MEKEATIYVLNEHRVLVNDDIQRIKCDHDLSETFYVRTDMGRLYLRCPLCGSE